MASMRDSSKAEWVGTGMEHINAGSLQRIADACEKMAANWSTLTSERDRYKRWYEEEKARVAKRDLQIRSLRGAVTRAKRGH